MSIASGAFIRRRSRDVDEAVAAAVHFPWVTVCWPMQVIDAPTANNVAGHKGAKSVLLSARLTPVRPLVPVFEIT